MQCLQLLWTASAWDRLRLSTSMEFVPHSTLSTPLSVCLACLPGVSVYPALCCHTSQQPPTMAWMLAFLLAPLRAWKWAEQLGLGIRKSGEDHPFQGSRRMAEHTPGTLEAMTFFGLPDLRDNLFCRGSQRSFCVCLGGLGHHRHPRRSLC